MGREKSDGRVVPEGRRKPDRAASNQVQQGKATTISKQAVQLGLRFETAEGPQGSDGEAERGSPRSATHAPPKSKRTKKTAPPAITLEEIATPTNLMRAWKRVASNDGAAGPDRMSVEVVREHVLDVTAALHRELLSEKYRPGMIRRVWIPKVGGERGLGIPNVIDRIVQQAIAQVMSPLYEPTFHPSSHGFRPGRSCHTAIAQGRQHVEDGHEWVVDIDLSKFFDRVHHERLLARLGQRVDDARVIRLIRHMLKAKVVMPDGVVVSTEEGTPQGGPLSPLLSNIVLDELDQELERRGHRFVRYADDCNIYVRSERAGQRVMASVTDFIERRLRLLVNADKSAVARPEERHFLGFRICRDAETGDVEVRLSARSNDRIAKKIRAMTPRTWGQRFADCIEVINAYVIGWVGFFWICTEAERQQLQRFDAHIRRRLRMILLRQWKRRRTIARRFIALGVKPNTAWRAVKQGRRSWWVLSHTVAADRALNKKRFEHFGLLSIELRWDALRARSETAPPEQLAFGVG